MEIVIAATIVALGLYFGLLRAAVVLRNGMVDAAKVAVEVSRNTGWVGVKTEEKSLPVHEAATGETARA